MKETTAYLDLPPTSFNRLVHNSMSTFKHLHVGGKTRKCLQAFKLSVMKNEINNSAHNFCAFVKNFPMSGSTLYNRITKV